MSKHQRLTIDDGVTIWQARDVYRAQTVLLSMFYLPQFFFALIAISALARGQWANAAVMILAIVALWAVRWLLCRGLPRLMRWSWAQLRGLRAYLPLGLLVLGLVGLSGCVEAGYRMNELYGINCRPEVLQNGQCVTTKRAQR